MVSERRLAKRLQHSISLTSALLKAAIGNRWISADGSHLFLRNHDSSSGIRLSLTAPGRKVARSPFCEITAGSRTPHGARKRGWCHEEDTPRPSSRVLSPRLKHRFPSTTSGRALRREGKKTKRGRTAHRHEPSGRSHRWRRKRINNGGSKRAGHGLRKNRKRHEAKKGRRTRNLPSIVSSAEMMRAFQELQAQRNPLECVQAKNDACIGGAPPKRQSALGKPAVLSTLSDSALRNVDSAPLSFHDEKDLREEADDKLENYHNLAMLAVLNWDPKPSEVPINGLDSEKCYHYRKLLKDEPGVHDYSRLSNESRIYLRESQARLDDQLRLKFREKLWELFPRFRSRRWLKSKIEERKSDDSEHGRLESWKELVLKYVADFKEIIELIQDNKEIPERLLDKPRKLSSPCDE